MVKTGRTLTPHRRALYLLNYPLYYLYYLIEVNSICLFSKIYELTSTLCTNDHFQTLKISLMFLTAHFVQRADLASLECLITVCDNCAGSF